MDDRDGNEVARQGHDEDQEFRELDAQISPSQDSLAADPTHGSTSASFTPATADHLAQMAQRRADGGRLRDGLASPLIQLQSGETPSVPRVLPRFRSTEQRPRRESFDAVRLYNYTTITWPPRPDQHRTKEHFLANHMETLGAGQIPIPDCEICFETYDLGEHRAVKIVGIEGCVDHIFGRRCLVEWINTNSSHFMQFKTCPKCRSILCRLPGMDLNQWLSSEQYNPHGQSPWPAPSYEEYQEQRDREDGLRSHFDRLDEHSTFGDRLVAMGIASRDATHEQRLMGYIASQEQNASSRPSGERTGTLPVAPHHGYESAYREAAALSTTVNSTQPVSSGRHAPSEPDYSTPTDWRRAFAAPARPHFGQRVPGEDSTPSRTIYPRFSHSLYAARDAPRITDTHPALRPIPIMPQAPTARLNRPHPPASVTRAGAASRIAEVNTTDSDDSSEKGSSGENLSSDREPSSLRRSSLHSRATDPLLNGNSRIADQTCAELLLRLREPPWRFQTREHSEIAQRTADENVQQPRAHPQPATLANLVGRDLAQRVVEDINQGRMRRPAPLDLDESATSQRQRLIDILQRQAQGEHLPTDPGLRVDTSMENPAPYTFTMDEIDRALQDDQANPIPERFTSPYSQPQMQARNATPEPPRGLARDRELGRRRARSSARRSDTAQQWRRMSDWFGSIRGQQSQEQQEEQQQQGDQQEWEQQGNQQEWEQQGNQQEWEQQQDLNWEHDMEL